MTRHGRNATAGMVYSYHERKKDSRESGWGDKEARMGKDSIKGFDCCSLTLQPCADPVITPDGYLYDKTAVLEYMIQQKKDIARKLKEYSKQKLKKEDELRSVEVKTKKKETQEFIKLESTIPSKSAFSHQSAASDEKPGSSISNMTAGKDKELPSFWLPKYTPQAKETDLEKPDERVRCPNSGKPLKMKDLITVKFTEIKDKEDKRSLIAKDLRYKCAVTGDALGNSVPCVVLRDSGDVVTGECFEKLIKPDMISPLTSKKLTDKDVIFLQRGASGFAGSGLDLKVKKKGATLMVA